MCGIAGFIKKCEDAEVRLSRMIQDLARRGPDGHGMWIDVSIGIALAQTRLSIIDLSIAGHQPMSYSDGRFWITFNGEIYNYKEIRSILEKEGFAFQTQTDTEVILAGWALWSTDVLTKLRGMFAFAIWDCKELTLTLCRDRMGIKPLLWAETTSGLVFASTLKAIIASGFVESVLEPAAIFDLFSTGSVCQPRTFIRGVRSLEPGTFLVFGPNSISKVIKYWDLPNEVALLQPVLSKLTYGDSVKLVREMLEEACRYHLVADVPVGSFLSGGIDSTAITAIMSRQTSKIVKSFSVGFEQTSEMKDELKEAKQAADFIGTKHTEILITGNDVESSFDDLVCTIDQPSYDGANTYFVSRASSREVKVALSGLGGDELFAGYGHFLTYKNADNKSTNWYNGILSHIDHLRSNRWTQTAALSKMTMPNRYAQLRRDFTDTDISKNFTSSILQYFSPGFLEDYIKQFLITSQNSITQTSLVECRHYLVNTLLRDADAMSMGHGLEVRPTFLDHKLVELALALPSEYKLQGTRGKAVLKDAVADLLPPNLLTRPKTGFSLPMGFWLRNKLRQRLLYALNGITAKSIFKTAFLDDCQKHIDDTHYDRTLWTLLIFVSWVEENKIQLI